MTTFLNKDTHLVDGDIGAKITNTDTVFLPPDRPGGTPFGTMQRNVDMGSCQGQTLRHLSRDEDEVHVRSSREHHLLGRGLHRLVHVEDGGAGLRGHAHRPQADLVGHQQLLQIVVRQLLQRARSTVAYLWIFATPK